MKPKLIIVSIAIAAMVTSAMAEEPDSVYIMPFAETHNTGRSGMKLNGVQMEKTGKCCVTDVL